MAMQMQSILARPSIGSSRTTPRMSLPSAFAPRLGVTNRVRLGVKCMAEERGSESESKIDLSSTPAPTPTPTPTPTPKPQRKASTSFGDVFAFSGPAPERINGRLAMIGFVAAVAVELAKGTDLLDQVSNGGAQWFLGTSILLSVASLVPLFKGERAEAKTEGFMNANAELWNGRLAMLGLIALAFTEYVKGGALI